VRLLHNEATKFEGGMTTLRILHLWLLLPVLTVPCAKGQSAPNTQAASQKSCDRVLLGAPIGKNDDEPPTVRFDMKLSNSQPASSPPTRTYDCSYIVRGKTSKFQLELSYGQLHDDGGFKVASGEGRCIAVPGSENAVLMQDLKSALLAKHVPGRIIRWRELRFDAVVWGQEQSENAGGGFSDKPPGDWIVLKLFCQKGGLRRSLLEPEPGSRQRRILDQR
jgi:hypothetical protein